MTRRLIVIAALLLCIGCRKYKDSISDGGHLESVLTIKDGGSGNGDVELRSSAFTYAYTTQFGGPIVAEVPYGSTVQLDVTFGTLHRWIGGACDGTAVLPCRFTATQDLTITAEYN